MNDRKWLNLVIFLMSTMILLFLIVQKRLENTPKPTVAPSYESLLNISFEAELLVLNGRWLPVEKLYTESTEKQWSEFLTSWKAFHPEVQLNAIPTKLLEINAITLDWVSAQQRRPFKLYRSSDGLIILIPQPSNEDLIYRYSVQQSQFLLPGWLIELGRI